MACVSAGLCPCFRLFEYFPSPTNKKSECTEGARPDVILLIYSLTIFSPSLPPQPLAELYIQGFEEALQLAAGGSRGQAIAVL